MDAVRAISSDGGSFAADPAAARVPAPVPATATSPGPNTVVRIMAPLPRLHYCCFMGDLAGVLECITEGHSIHEALSMQNQHEQIVCGITPLFLAAQRGHTKVCKLLVENGANPNQPSYIEGSTDLCTPAEVAQLNLHLMLARYLRKAVKQRRKEDAVITQDEEDTERVRQRVESGTTAGPAVAAAGSPGTARAFMANLSDLSNWDPATGAPARLTGNKVKKMMQKQKIDLYTWQPQEEPTASSAAVTSPTGEGTSASRVVDPSELEVPPDIPDHGKMLTKFLKDLDLQVWNPQQEEAQQRRQQGRGSMDMGRQGSLARQGSLGGLASWFSGRRRGSIDARGAGDAKGAAPATLGGAIRSSFNRGGSNLSIEGRGGPEVPAAPSMPRSLEGAGEISTPPTPRSPRQTDDEGNASSGVEAQPPRDRGGVEVAASTAEEPPSTAEAPPPAMNWKAGPGTWRLMGGLWSKRLYSSFKKSGSARHTQSERRPATGEGASAAATGGAGGRSMGRHSRQDSIGYGAEGGDDADLPVSNSRVARPDDEEAAAAVLEVLQRAREGR